MTTPPREDTAAPAETPRWFGPQGSTRFHYFDADLRSLCGKWMLWRDPASIGLDWGTAISNASGDCAACTRALAKRTAAAGSS